MKHSRENTRKPTKRSIEKNIQPQEYNSNYQSSETIAKSIFDKIFIFAFYEGYSKELERNMGNYCYEYMKKEITSFFELTFINYTKSNNEKEKSEELLWEMEPPIENTWEEIFEPESEPIDRYESAQILYQEIKRDDITNQIKEKGEKKILNNKLNENKKTNKNKKIKKSGLNHIINEVEEKSSKSGFDNEFKIEKEEIKEISRIENKSSGSLNATDDEIKKNIENVTENQINNIKINNIRIDQKRKTTKRKSNMPIQTLPPIVQKRGRNTIIFNYPYIDIPGIEQEFNHQNLEPSNIDTLRQEREEFIKKKLIESKTEKNINKVRKANNENSKGPKKIFDSKHLTFDSNGNIINFHPYKLDKLKKEFTLIKNLIKGEPPKKENSKSKGKNQSSYLFKEKKKEPIEEKKGKELVEKPEPLFEDKNIKEKEKYIPSGSNFQIISPNIGVTIKENNKFKQGSKEFSKYFQKYSLNDYDKMLNDYVPLQNKTLLKNKLQKLNLSSSTNYIATIPSNTITKLSKKTSNNSLANSYDYNTNNINNPLLTDAQEVNNSNNNNINLNININSSISNNNPLLSSNFKTINYNSNKSLNTENSSIIMKKLGTNSLKIEIDNLKDLTTINPNLLSRTNKSRNIFRYNSYKNYKTFRIIKNDKINIFTELNKKIMNSRDWGNDLNDKKNTNKDMGFSDDNKRYARHITKQQILRELGNNILSGIKFKLPRDRKVELLDNI